MLCWTWQMVSRATILHVITASHHMHLVRSRWKKSLHGGEKNKLELLPALVWTRERERHSSKLAFTDPHSLVSYVPKKNRNVIVMSRLHKDYAVSTTEDRKPNIIQGYNSSKGGVDCLDKVMYIFYIYILFLLIIVFNRLFIVSFLANYWYRHLQVNGSTLACGGVPQHPGCICT